MNVSFILSNLLEVRVGGKQICYMDVTFQAATVVIMRIGFFWGVRMYTIVCVPISAGSYSSRQQYIGISALRIATYMLSLRSRSNI